MTDETDTVSEVARVLAEAAPCRWSIPAPMHPHADACRHRTHDRGHGVCWDVAVRQAAMLAEAGLLRDPMVQLIREAFGTARPAPAQIATQAPAEQPQPASGGNGAGGGLGERLRAAADYQDRPGAYDELRAMADEADRLETERAAWQRQAEINGRGIERYGAQQDEMTDRLQMLRELAGAIRATAHCSHLADDIETLLNAPIDELRENDEEEGA